MVTNKDFEAAKRRAQEFDDQNPRVIEATFNSRQHRVLITLSSGIDVSFDPSKIQGLESAKDGQLRRIEILGRHAVYFPDLDADVYVPGLLAGLTGSAAWMAAQFGARGGRSRSTFKAAASRRNGRLGGRPKKVLLIEANGSKPKRVMACNQK